MKKVRNHNRLAFTLTEMLIATGIMTIGLVLIATIFPVGVKLTGLSAERSVAVVAADEAFAKVQLYRLRDFQYWPVTAPNDPNTTCTDYMYTTLFADDPGTDGFYGTPDDVYIDSVWDEFLYPSAVVPPEDPQKYHWSTLCRRAGNKDVQITVFVTHTTFAGMDYYEYPYNSATSVYEPTDTGIWPTPVPVNVRYNNGNAASPPLKELVIDLTDPINSLWGLDVYSFFDDGYTIVNNRNGKIYRILEMRDELPQSNPDGRTETIVLYEDWQWDGYDSDPLSPPATTQYETVWVVPPGVGSSRYPCVGVFQRVIRFDEIQ